jgi:hypothetical protein
MKRLIAVWCCLSLLAVSIHVGLGSGAAAQDGDAATETVEAYRTRLAQRDATVEAQSTRIADLEATIAASQPTARPTRTPRPRKPKKTSKPVPLTDATELLYYYFAADRRGDAALFGEVRNTSDAEVVSPYVRFTLLDADGNIVDTVIAFPLFPFVAAGKTVPISVAYLGLKPGDWASEQVTACGDVSTDPVPPGLSVEGVKETRKDQNGLELEGKVRNGGDAPAAGVEAVAVLYREDGRFGGSGVGLIESAIPPGKTARFRVSAFGAEMAGVTEDGPDYTYEVVASVNAIGVYTC